MEQWLLQVFSHPDPIAMVTIAAKTAVIYVLLVLGLRLLGSRALGEMSGYDFVLAVVIANSVQNALVGGDNTLVGGLVSAFTLLVVNRSFTWALTSFTWLERQVVGEPVVLVSAGVVHKERMKRVGVDHDELMAALREHGIDATDAVKLAVLEVDGTVSVVPKDAAVHRTRRRVRGMRTD